jgi:hypothetical protein
VFLGEWLSRGMVRLPSGEKGCSPRRGSPREQKELLGKEDGCSSSSGKNFPMGRRGIPWEGESPPRIYVPKGRVKLWLRMCCIPKNKVPRDWMQHRGERRMGVP